ncbi:hypothetical protein PFICI_13915 [Pestalotiopsis fici W106-1]|uniref:Uncharacterized protein n=1 Tax=Pestalotiopsis fici (strain W106-1 / CGMCC3.15140) TaxID=1229662 RepID=W3WJV1_PESFW|nr:uncharacterized protein PFICI_13915 [Pestalotiopsis fici W106-1]ETS74049.1 hypothetical protein PFICI_13915 [Pestalotiopsis fici W106-1]
MSTTTTSASASATCGARLYDIPVQDAACALPYGGNHTDIMSACCKSADVISYYGDCGVYCLALDQSVADLTSCLFDQGAADQDVFCRGNTTATATGSGDSVPTSASASVVASATGDSSSGSGTSTGSGSASETSKSAAAPRSQAAVGVTTLGLTIGALLFSATTLGAFAL